MKRFRGTYVFAIVVVLVIGFAVYDRSLENRDEAVKEAAAGLVKLAVEDVTRIEIANRLTSTVLEKKDGKWLLAAPAQEVADPKLVEGFLSSVAAENAVDEVESGEKVDWKIYGLDTPVTTLTLSTGKGETSRIRIGSVKAYDGNLYARVNDEPRVRLVTQSWDPLLAKQAKDFRDKHLFRERASWPAIERVEIAHGKRDFELSKKDGQWKFTRGGVDYPLVQDAVTSYIELIKSVEAAELSGETAAGSQKKYGLDKPTFSASLFADAKDPLAQLWLGKSDEKPPEGSKQDPLVPAASTETRGGIAFLIEGVALALHKTPQDFYDRKLPFKFAADEVGRIKIEYPGRNGEYLKKGDSWVPADPGLQNPFDSTKLKDLITKLGRMEAIRILEGFKPGKAPELGVGSKIILSKESGERVFEFAWGEMVTEKGEGGRPEAVYLRAHTSRTDHLIGVPELSVRALGIQVLPD